MAIVPFRQRVKELSVGWLRDGTGERFMYAFGTLVDARLEKVAEAMRDRMPLIRRFDDRNENTWIPPHDVLLVLAGQFVITPGLTESNLSLGSRVRVGLPTWRYGGTNRGVLMQVLGYLLALTPTARIVSTRYAPDSVRLLSALTYKLGVIVVGATNTNPITITTGAPHGFATGDNATVTGVLGNTAANGAWTVTVVDPTSFSLDTSNGSGTYTTGGRAVLTSAIPSATDPAAMQSTTWDSYPAGRPLTEEPVRTYVTSSGGNWDWDSLSPVTGSYGWWDAYLVIYSVPPNDWCAPAQDWGDGSTYTAAASGDYATVTGGFYVDAGSYSGTSQRWGDGSTYTAAASGDYATVTGGFYVDAGSYTGASQGWGFDKSTDFMVPIVAAVLAFKRGQAWFREIIISFNASLFDPSQPAGGGVNPDVYFGTWSKVSGGLYVEARFSDAIYCGEVIQ